MPAPSQAGFSQPLTFAENIVEQPCTVVPSASARKLLPSYVRSPEMLQPTGATEEL